MANNSWIGGTDTSINEALNWVDGVPTNDDDLFFTGSPTHNPTTDLATLDAITGLTMHVDDTWTGAIGDASNALQVSTGAILHFDNTRGGVANFDMPTDGTVFIRNTPATAKIYFSAGTLALVVLDNGSGAIFNGSTITMMRMLGPALTTIQATSTLTALSMQHPSAHATVQCAFGTADILAGEFDHIGGAVGGTTLNAWGGLARLRCTGLGTYTKINALGATVRMDESGANRTVTNADVFAGLFNAPAVANITHTNAVAWYGGICIATSISPQSPGMAGPGGGL